MSRSFAPDSTLSSLINSLIPIAVVTAAFVGPDGLNKSRRVFRHLQLCRTQLMTFSVLHWSIGTGFYRKSVLLFS